jgi:hypothetical protein
MTEEKETVKIEKPTKQAKKTEADVIWDEISKLSISMFALPAQKVEQHLEKLPVPGKSLYVRPRSTAVITSLEEAIGENYEINTTENGYLIISRLEKLPDLEEDYVVFQRNGKVEKIPRKKYYGSSD